MAFVWDRPSARCPSTDTADRHHQDLPSWRQVWEPEFIATDQVGLDPRWRLPVVLVVQMFRVGPHGRDRNALVRGVKGMKLREIETVIQIDCESSVLCNKRVSFSGQRIDLRLQRHDAHRRPICGSALRHQGLRAAVTIRTHKYLAIAAASDCASATDYLGHHTPPIHTAVEAVDRVTDQFRKSEAYHSLLTRHNSFALYKCFSCHIDGTLRQPSL